MLTHTRIVFDKAGELVAWDGYVFSGPVVKLKKGRAGTTQAQGLANQEAGRAAANANQDRSRELGYADKSDPFASSLIPNANGDLSPYAKAQFQQDQRNIAKNYGDVQATGIKALAQRGMGGAPTGATSSLLNTAGRNQAEDTTNAYERAQQATLGQGLQGIGYLQGQEQVFDPNKARKTAIDAASAAADAGAKRAKMGSGLGDVGAGLAGVGAAFA